jgi:hypothetical protein
VVFPEQLEPATVSSIPPACGPSRSSHDRISRRGRGSGRHGDGTGPPKTCAGRGGAGGPEKDPRGGRHEDDPGGDRGGDVVRAGEVGRRKAPARRGTSHRRRKPAQNGAAGGTSHRKKARAARRSSLGDDIGQPRRQLA